MVELSTTRQDANGRLIRLGPPQKMVDMADGMTLRRRIDQRLKALKLSMRAASVRAGLGTHFLRDLMDNEDQSPRADNLAKLANALETTPEWLLEERGDETPQGIPVMGYVGAGAHYKPYEDQGNIDYADVPPGARDAFGAAYVRGNSAYPAYRDGDLIYFTEFREDVDNFLGEDVIAELPDGAMLLKRLEARGNSPGLYVLGAYNAPSIFDAPVIRVAAIRWIDRRPSRR